MSNLHRNLITGGLVEVIFDSGDFVAFYPQGGGFQFRMPTSEFHATFAPSELGGYVLSKVCIDDDETSYTCLLNEALWNGWRMPLFDRETARLVARDFSVNGFMIREHSDCFTIEDENYPEEMETYKATVIDGVEYFGIGSGSWIWTEVKED